MSRWSESVYSEPNSSRVLQLGFLTELDARLYEGVPMSDPQLDAEASEWAARFVHLRVRGVKCATSTRRTNGDHTRVRKEEAMELQTTAIPNLTRSSKTPLMKKSPNSAELSRSSSDRLPKMKNMKR